MKKKVILIAVIATTVVLVGGATTILCVSRARAISAYSGSGIRVLDASLIISRHVSALRWVLTCEYDFPHNSKRDSFQRVYDVHILSEACIHNLALIDVEKAAWRKAWAMADKEKGSQQDKSSVRD